MHEFLPAAYALGGSLSLFIARLMWLRRRLAPLRIGDVAPPIGHLPSASGTPHGSAVRGSPIVVLFISNSCPGVKAYDARLRALHATYAVRGVAFVAVNAINEDLYPAEDLAGMTIAARERRLPFPYVKDRDQQLARAYGAVCTPHVFLIDAGGRLRYRGRIDDAMLERKATKHFLRDAIEAILDGKRAPVADTAPLGCAIEFSRPSSPPAKHTPGAAPSR